MKKNRSTKKFIRNILFIFVPFMLLVLVTTSTEKNLKAENDEIVVTPKNTPNPPPKKFIGIWMSNGYGLQPNPNYYTTVGDSVTIRTDAGRSIWSVMGGLFDSPHYRWSQTTDGKKWTDVSKGNGGQKKNFTVKPSKVGTVWYQLDTQYYNYLTGWMAKTHIYSNLTAVHTLPDPVDATDLEITVDDEYLYNTGEGISNTTYAHAMPTPANATGKIKWSIDKPELATIDPDDGLITANKNRLSGDVLIKATMTNPNTGPIEKEKKVTIGGGLDDQSVKSGEDATFSLKGDTGGDGDDENSGSITVDWYRTNPGETKETKISSGQSTSYTVKNATMADDGALYKAVITFQVGLSKKYLTSNKAKLSVIASGKPEIEITNKMTDDTYPHDENSDHKLVDVVNGDSITYQDTISNISQEGPLQNSSYVLPLRSGTQINSIKVDGVELDDSQSDIIFDNDTDTDDLVINLGTIGSGVSKNVEVNTTVLGIMEKTSLEFQPYIYGSPGDGSGSTYLQKGAEEELHYITDKIHPNIDTMDFGAINAYSKNKLKYRPDNMNNPNNVVNIDDQRREKHAMNVFVEQSHNFTNTNGDVLPASLRYYEDGNYQNILNNKVKITQSDVGTELNSIAWNKDEGLLLHIDGGHMVAGLYTTVLTWNFENSI